MSKIDARLPSRILAGLRIGPEWKSEVVEGANGWEKREGKWMYPRWRATGSIAAYEAPERERFRAMFVVARGKLRAFRVRDPLDWIVTNDPLPVPSAGTKVPLQLVRQYTFPGSSESYSIPVRAPVVETVIVTCDGTPVSGTIDPETGLFTPASNWVPGDYAWSGQFDRWMRFASDWGVLNAPSSNINVADIELIEVR